MIRSEFIDAAAIAAMAALIAQGESPNDAAPHAFEYAEQLAKERDAQAPEPKTARADPFNVIKNGS
jgi:hypothetical protein